MGRFKNGKVINSKRPEFKRMKVQQQVLEIRDVCELDAGNYTVVMRNPSAALERRLSLTLIVNGNQQSCRLLWDWQSSLITLLVSYSNNL